MADGELSTPPRVVRVGVVLLALGAGLAIFFVLALWDMREPPPYDSDSLIVDNRTDSRIVITLTLEDGLRQVAAIGPNTTGYAGGTDRCYSSVLHARLKSLTDEATDTPPGELPVIDRRAASEGEECTRIWVVERE